jgi:DNA-binding IclR family transcriptional regulator
VSVAHVEDQLSERLDRELDIEAAESLCPDRPSRHGVVERVTLILDAFTDAPGGLLLEDVTRITGLPRSTAFRILRQLTEQHWVEHSSRGYRLGPRMSSMAARAVDYEEIRAAASVALNDLHLATQAVAHLSVLEGGIVRYLDKVGGAAANTVPSRVGARILACDTVSGRALLAHLSPENVEVVLEAAVRGREIPIDLSALHRELASVRMRNGAAVMTGAMSRTGISSVAVPVMGPRGPVAAVSVADRQALVLGRVVPLLMRAARATSAELFPDWDGARGPVSSPPRRRTA